MKTGDKIKCVNNSPLEGNNIAPPLIGKEYTVKEVILDSKGNSHLDVGLKSRYNFITSFETKEELPRGNYVHWCHPSRFALLLVFIFFTSIAVEAKPKRGKSIHWESRRNTASGRHNVFIPNWGGNSYCATYPTCYIKRSSYKRYKNFRHGKVKN